MSTWLALLLSFGKIGLVSLGGGNSMLKLIQTETVDYRHWIGTDEFVSMVGSSFLFPGLTAVKLAAMIGYKTGGIVGLCTAVLALNIPGLLLAVIGYSYLTSHNGPNAYRLMTAVQYGALALLASASYAVAEGVFGQFFNPWITLLTIVFFIALTFFNVSPFWGFFVFIGIGFCLVT